MQKAFTVLVILGLIVAAGFGVKHYDKQQNKLQIQTIQLKDKAAELELIELRYDELSHELNQARSKSETSKEQIDRLEAEKNRLEQETKSLEAQLQAKREAQESQRRNVAYAATLENLPTDKKALMRLAGISESDYQYVDYILSKESGWRHTVYNGAGSGAYGLCQSLPASKMASAGSDYMTNPVTQLKWCNSYAKQRYGGWAQAYSFWVSNHWW